MPHSHRSYSRYYRARHMMPRTRLALYCMIVLASPIATAQERASPIRIGGISMTGSLRGRAEDWNWFRTPSEENHYTYGTAVLRLNFAQSGKRFEWQAEGGF